MYPSLATIVEQDFPRLDRSGQYVPRSPCEPAYNCIAFAAGDSRHWWWPDDGPADWWPSGLRRDGTIEAFEDMFEILGYSPCTTESHEGGFEKIALFADGKQPRHAARQEVGSGLWLSKLGQVYDIAHDNLHDLESIGYGRVVRTFRRSTSELVSTGIQLLYAHQGHTETSLVRMPRQVPI